MVVRRGQDGGDSQSKSAHRDVEDRTRRPCCSTRQRDVRSSRPADASICTG